MNFTQIKKLITIGILEASFCILIACGNTAKKEEALSCADDATTLFIDTSLSITSAEPTSPPETSISTKLIETFDFSGYSTEVQEYVNELIANKTFNSLIDEYELAQVIDLNNDNIPEIIIECCPFRTYETHYSYVFSKDDDMVFAANNQNTGIPYSYYGALINPFIDNDGNTVFIADVLYGGAGTGEFGKITVNFDGKNIYTKNLFKYNWLDPYDLNSIQYQYFDGGFTSQKDNDEYDTYINSLTKKVIYNKFNTLIDENYQTKEQYIVYTAIADLIQGFYA